MADSVFLTFVMPELSTSVHGILQIVFALVFLAVLGITPSLVRRAARSEQWQRRLDRIDSADDPVATYATPEELSGAVATPAERWADVLPSLVLVFGLLGTFIGLGLALTEAASVLSNGQHAGGNPLDNLTPIMSSLGSKFKTSTWGILAFLSLKVWFMLRPYEEQRLAWAAQKIKARAAQAALHAAQQEAAERQRLIDTIAQSNGALLAEQQRTAAAAERRHESSLALLQQLASQQIEAQAQASNAQLTELQRATAAAGQQHQAAIAALQQGDARLLEAITQTSAAQLEEQQRATQQAASLHASTADALARMAEQDARATAQLTGRADQQIKQLDELKEHTAATRIAMDGFVHSVQDNISTMATAADNMARAADAAGKASVDLGVVIDDFRTTMSSVLGDIKSGLGESINTMQANFSANMSAMSDSLAHATTGIETAISQLSTGVNDTINALKQANTESVTLQTRAQATFAASGEELMTSLGDMQEYVSEMRTRMESGMASVATAGQKMLSAIAKITELQSAFDASNSQTQALVKNTDSLSADIRQLVAGVAGQQQSRDAMQTDIAQLSANVAELLSAQQQALQNDSHTQLVDTLERAAQAWSQPARVADESIERLVSALSQPSRVADETPA
jgi:hypothetical protein